MTGHGSLFGVYLRTRLGRVYRSTQRRITRSMFKPLSCRHGQRQPHSRACHHVDS
jgi:hypothetical protein